MCRSIKSLRSPEPAGDAEVREAALQYVRKVSGFRVPSQANEEVFEAAIAEVADATERLLSGLTVHGRPVRP